ncbi:hypothetical protein [Vibrio owensii]|uniref:DUF5983 family protein n=1 Tax=Vibrio owensii TaxID=696485 RepID=UPI0018F14D3E|nr:hypothetical protein [Vibrio owensii]
MTKLKLKSLPSNMQSSTYQALLVSVDHLEVCDKVILSDLANAISADIVGAHSILFNRVFERDSGYFIKLMWCEDSSDLDTELATFQSVGLSDGLLNIIKFALEHEVTMLEFDCDGEVFECFK